jgi:type I restriction enzyme S subunit
MSWQLSTLGAIIAHDGGVLQTGPFGSQLHQSDYQPEGVPVIMPKDIVDGDVREQQVARISEAFALRLQRHKLRARSIVLPRRGEISKRAFIRPEQEGWLCGTGCLKIELNGRDLLPEYLYYYMAHPTVVKWLEQNAVGTTMLNLSAEIVRRMPVRYPSLPVQEGIVKTLSSYDELMANNRSRIDLLEQSAQLLFKEWFVHLRYPGHEHDKATAGVPEGWERKQLSELVMTQYGYTETATEEPIGPRFLRGTDINKTSYIDWSEVPYCPEQTLEFEKYALRLGDIVVIRMADPGKVAIVEREIRAIFASYLVRLSLRHDSGLRPYYLFYCLSGDAYQGYVSNASTGSTRKSAGAPLLTNFDLLRPPMNLQEAFDDNVAPIRSQINTLLVQNAALKSARDLLLPRLMNGRISI